MLLSNGYFIIAASVLAITIQTDRFLRIASVKELVNTIATAERSARVMTVIVRTYAGSIMKIAPLLAIRIAQ